MLEKTAAATRANVDGAIIPARSGNDTNTNPHNPMYGIAAGEVVTLIGSRSTDSGGNSIAPAMLMDPEIRPTKVDRPSDVTGMVDTGNLTGILGPDDVVPVMESIARISDQKLRLGTVNTGVTRDEVIKEVPAPLPWGGTITTPAIVRWARFATCGPVAASVPVWNMRRGVACR